MNTVKGDLLALAEAGMFDLIIHGANCHNTFGAGLAKQIKLQYPEAYAADCATVSGDKTKLGTYSTAITRNSKFVIINAYTQFNTSRGEDVFEYDAFSNILSTIASTGFNGRVGLPLIGCGLARGNKLRILAIINEFATQIETLGGSVTIVEFN